MLTGSMSVVMNVAATDADGMDGDLHIFRPDLAGKFDVADGEFAFAFQNEGFHDRLPVVRGLRLRG